MEYIVFYISSHGFGHLTRSLAIIDELLSITDYNIYIVCSEKQNNFAKKYLHKFSKRVSFRNLNTDIGLINKTGSLEVDKSLLEIELNKFTSSWENTVKKEVNFFNRLNIRAIISDISSIGILTAKQLKITLIKISNFTWLHQYEFLNLSRDIKDIFKNSYKGIDLYIEYDLALDHSFIESNKERTGFICRKIDYHKVSEIKRKFGDILFISCGKSADLDEITINNFDGTIIYTEGIKVKSNSKTYKLPLEILDSHNYLAASKLAMIKAGWGSIAEGLIAHTPLILMERNGVLEDSFMINELKKRNLAVSINTNQMLNFDYSYWREIIKTDIDNNLLQQIENSVEQLVNLILKNI